MQGFTAWLRAADTEVKRDMEISRDEVRVMTVHGAKGLEAPVVFLVDTTTSPADTTRLKLIRLPQGNAAPDAPGVVVWAGKKAEDPPAVAAARAAMLAETEDEYRRLLYVAMTRAADRLIVAGCMPGNRNMLRELSWYDLIAKGLAVSGLHMQNVPPPDGVVKRYSRLEDIQPELATSSRKPTAAIPLPAWLRTKVLRDPRPREFPAAVRSGRRRSPRRQVRRFLERAPERGSAAHWFIGCCNRCRIFPPTAGSRRAANYLGRNTDDWSDAQRDALAAQVLALIADGASLRYFRPAAVPKSPSRDGSIGPGTLGRWCPARSTGWS